MRNLPALFDGKRGADIFHLRNHTWRNANRSQAEPQEKGNARGHAPHLTAEGDFLSVAIGDFDGVMKYLRNVIENNLFFNIDTVMRCNAKWGEWRGNCSTTQDPGFIDINHPLQGFKPDAEILRIIPDLAKILFASIGSTLTSIEHY